MTKRWIMDKQSRRKKVYIEKHRQLRAEVSEARKPQPSKSERKRHASMMFRQQAER
jgi:hypothetical protein